ncbi:MAG: DNRLRE domain-containing protein [Luteolibacter sp.]
MKITYSLLALISVFASTGAAFGTTVMINPLKDNSIFSGNTGNSSGSSSNLFAGQTNGSSNNRALLSFDVASFVPSGATINSVTLSLNMNNVGGGESSARTYTLHRLLTNWGEGASNATGGSGAAAVASDATWVSAMHGSTAWSTAGGDFIAGASASASVGTDLGLQTWSSTATSVADVQSWLDTPAQNFGWILIGDETASGSARRFDSREGSTAPVLSIDYTAVPEPSSGVLVIMGMALAVGQRSRTKVS